MYTKKIRVVLAYAVLCITSSLACAGTVDFNVPVEVKSYQAPNGKVGVWCELRSSQDQGISANYKLLMLNGGAWSGSTHVEVTYRPEEAVNIRNFRCALVVDTKSTSLGSGMSSMIKAIPSDATILQQVSGPLK